MLWVGGGILVHGLEEFHMAALPHAAHVVSDAVARLTPFAPGLGEWFGFALASALVGLIVGGIVALIVPRVMKLFGKSAPAH
jgi:predicted DNA repair protein MutK